MSKRFTEAEIAEVWERRKAGEPTRSIARRLGRNGSSIRRLFEDAGGVRPAPRRRAERHLTLAEREEISRGVAAGESLRVIVAGYWVTGPVTVNDLITSGNEAIAWHHNQPAQLEQVTTDDWTRQVWRRDLRFRDLLPGVDATVHDIATSGHHTHQRYLLKTLPKLEKRLDVFGRESRDEALIRYVSANTGQSRQRTTRLLQSLSLLEPTITGSEAGRQLGVSPQRIYQLVGQIRHRIEQAQPPNGAPPWLPQDPTAVPSLLETQGMGR